VLAHNWVNLLNPGHDCGGIERRRRALCHVLPP
jgi:hypothetical protein